MTLINRLRNLEPIERIVLKLATLSIGLILLASSLGIALSARSRSDQAVTSVQASCQFWHDLAGLPLSDTSTRTAFTIIADARIAYAKQDCSPLVGELPAPDARVVPFLPAGLR